ncbi:MAG TPA: M28 family peptidase [Acidimicrobiales bacterium]|nr:M28 family peptidase [Acidimicrobiales bacterium]
MRERWTRRDFLTRTGVTAGALTVGIAACSSGSDDPPEGAGGQPEGAPGRMSPDGVIAEDDVPTQAAIFAWISEVFGQGVRRPGYPADEWAEGWIADRFRDIGLEDVRLEPVTCTRWEPLSASLDVTAGGETRSLDCFPVPFATPVSGLEVEVVAFDQAQPGAVAGKASLCDVPLIRIPADLLASSGSAPDDLTGRIVDPDGTLTGAEHVVPFGAGFQDVLEPSIEAGAAFFIGSLTGYPGNSYKYFVPYDGIGRPIPGVWIRGTDGAWLRERLAEGPVRIAVTVESEMSEVESHNVVGELPGADDEMVIIGSHHDGPWSSAVEDGSGISLVLAQATYWAAQPVERRPHRLVFLLQGGHMSGGAGLHAYIDAHRDELDSVVLEVHLEHAALEFAETDGTLAPTGLPVPRWFFTSRLAPLEGAVSQALQTERLHRSMILAPDAFGSQPPTDGAFYHTEGVPVMNFLTAPFYLFDEIDTLDKIDQENLVPLTRATIRIVDWTMGKSAAEVRAG